MSGISDGDEGGVTGQAGEERGGDFLIVGLGASAGGIKAFKQFFERVPAASGMAYVVILRLSPEHESHLAEVLQASSTIPVAQVHESVRIEPDHVYVIPPNKSLSMSDGVLVLSEIKGYEERRGRVLQQVLLAYAGARMAQLSQRAVCGGRHKLSERLCCWLLLLQDRAGDDSLKLTHDLIACHLGVRRAGITENANALRDAGVISYNRGLLRVLDRQRLEAAACECYQ